MLKCPLKLLFRKMLYLQTQHPLIRAFYMKLNQGMNMQLTNQSVQGMQTTANDGRHVVQDAMAKDGTEHTHGARDTQADTQVHSSGRPHIATDMIYMVGTLPCKHL